MFNIKAIVAAMLLVTVGASACAQEEAGEADKAYTDTEIGGARHTATGIECPPELGDAALTEVLSFDREGEHLGLTCQYTSAIGSVANLSILRSDVPELVGAGSQSRRWNAAVYKILVDYPSAMPEAVDGLGADEAANLRSALFAAPTQRGMAVVVGLWFMDSDAWSVRGDATIVPNPGGWAAAKALRQAVLDAKPKIAG